MKRFLTAGGLMLWAGAAMALEDFIDGVRVQDSAPGIADLFVYDTTVLDGKLCVGEGCVRAEVFDADTLVVLKSESNIIDFFDTSTTASQADTNWQIRANEPGPHGENWFAIRNATDARTPFKIWVSAEESTLALNSYGVGIGTQSPQADLHVVSGGVPDIRLELDGSQGKTPYAWDQYLGATGALLLWDRTGGERRMVFHPATTTAMQSLEVYGDGSLVLTDDGGNVGFSPRAPLHLTHEDGSTVLLVEERSATSAARTLLQLENNGRPEIVMANTNTGGEWSFGAGTNFLLKTGAVGSDSSAKTKHLTLYGATGDLEITGSIITGGTTCGGGCDRVFADDYDLPSISEHAEAMYALGHLPNIGPTPENQPFNLSEKLGRMLNELEHAHIYIAQLEARDVERAAANRDLLARVETLEKALAALAATR